LSPKLLVPLRFMDAPDPFVLPVLSIPVSFGRKLMFLSYCEYSRSTAKPEVLSHSVVLPAAGSMPRAAVLYSFFAVLDKFRAITNS